MAESRRILSIDAPRGFDMMWIAGVDRVLKRAGAALNSDFGAAFSDLPFRRNVAISCVGVSAMGVKNTTTWSH